MFVFHFPFLVKDKCSVVAEMGERMATIDGAVPLLGGAGSPSNTMWPGPRLQATTDMGRKLVAVPLRGWIWVPI